MLSLATICVLHNGLLWHSRLEFKVVDDNTGKISSIPDRQDAENGRMILPKFTEIFVDEKRLLINIPNPHEGQSDFTLMAPSKLIFEKVVAWFDKYMTTAKKTTLEVSTVAEESYDSDENFDDADNHEDLIDFPSDGSDVQIVLWFLLYPLRFVMHYTLPDVRQLDSNGEMKIAANKRVLHAFGSTFMCLVWLIIGR
jgi:hypothetical protein